MLSFAFMISQQEHEFIISLLPDNTESTSNEQSMIPSSSQNKKNDGGLRKQPYNQHGKFKNQQQSLQFSVNNSSNVNYGFYEVYIKNDFKFFLIIT
jgi:hypothetical protein